MCLDTTGPVYKRKFLNSTAFHSFTSLKDLGLLTKSFGIEFRSKINKCDILLIDLEVIRTENDPFIQRSIIFFTTPKHKRCI